MKMTDADERALAAVHKALRQVPMKDGDADWFAAQDAYEHLRARLAADQQKGGGEEAVDLSAALRKVRNRASEPGTSAHHGEQFVSGMRCAANMLENMSIVKAVYTTPQPSIPAPAQQEVGDVEAVEFRAAFFVSKDGNRVEQLTSYEDYRSDGAILRLMDLGQKRASAKKLTKKGGGKVVLSWIGAALAHPPHADQETQS